MIMGATSAVLVTVSLRRLGTAPAVIGGLFFAVFYPAVYSRHTTELEGLSTLLLMICVAVLSDQQSRWRSTPVLMAGVLLGMAAATKIWGVAGVVAVACYALNHLRSGDVTVVARFRRGQGFSRAQPKPWPAGRSCSTTDRSASEHLAPDSDRPRHQNERRSREKSEPRRGKGDSKGGWLLTFEVVDVSTEVTCGLAG